MEEQLAEAVQFFESEKVYDKLFRLFRKKYESIGRIGGTVSVVGFSEADLETLGQFFGIPGEIISGRGTIALRDFAEQLAVTRFDQVSLKNVLDAHFGETILSKKEQLEERNKSRTSYFQQLAEKHPVLTCWFSYILEEHGDSRWIMQMAEKDSVQFQRFVSILDQALLSLPEEPERLPMFSQRITGDPHAFDLQIDGGRLLLHVLAVMRAEGEQAVIPISTEDINQLLEHYHIFRDDILNFVTCANLLAKTKEGVHPVWQAAAQQNSVQIVPLRELVTLVGAHAVYGENVFVVENSGVCAKILDQVPHAPLVCTNGQLTLAAWTLLDVEVAGGATLYYAGDFDPEGLRIADRLVERFGASIKLWHMDMLAYKQSQPSKIVSRERLEKLGGISDEGLRDVAAEMVAKGMAGYQEALVEQMVEDIRGHVGASEGGFPYSKRMYE